MVSDQVNQRSLEKSKIQPCLESDIMDYTLLLLIIGYIVSASLCIIIAILIMNWRKNPGSIFFILLMLNFATWSLARLVGLISPNHDVMVFGELVAFLPQTITAPLIFSFISQMAKKDGLVKPVIHWLLWIPPAILFIFALTNKFHNLIFRNISFEIVRSMLIFVSESGPLVYVNVVYSYVLIAISLYWLLIHLRQSSDKGIVSAVMIIAITLVSMVVKFLQVINASLISIFDITPLFFPFLALALFWGIKQQHLFNIRPIAYQTLLDNAPDGVIVINKQGNIIEANKSAGNILDLDYKKFLGEKLSHIAPDLCMDDPHCFGDVDQLDKVMELPGSPKKIVKLSMRRVTKKNGKLVGHIISCQDITALRQAQEELRKKYHFTDLLIEATSEINTTLDLDAVLEKILQKASEVVPYDEADIVLIDDGGNHKFVSVKSFMKNHPMDFVLDLEPMNDELYGFERMSRTGEKILINDIRNNPNWNPAVEGTDWIRSYLGVPIQHRGKILGFINLAMGKPNAFSEEQARQIQVFANYAASAIINATLFNETERFAMELSVLNEISQVINADIELQETLRAISRELQLIISIDFFGITFYQEESHIVEKYLYRADETRIDIPPFNVYKKDSITRFVIEESRRLYIPDIFAEDSEINPQEIAWIGKLHFHTLLAIPLVSRGDVFGVLLVGSTQIDAYTSDQIEMIEAIALQNSAAINNARLFEQVQEQAITDALTNLDNRRHFDMKIKNEIDRARRYQHNFSLIMMDIDHFKSVNDRYGHLAGDYILREIAKLSKGLLRKADSAFRYGGEEFMFLLPETKKEEAFPVAERIRQTIEDTQFVYKDTRISLTVSLGICDFQDEKKDPDALINSVDNALYEAKESGRNNTRMCAE